MAELIAVSLACLEAATALDKVITLYNRAPSEVQSLRGQCVATRTALRSLKKTLDASPLREVEGHQDILETFRRYQRQFDSRLKEFIVELDSYHVVDDGVSPLTRRPSWGRIRLTFRRNVIEEMKREIADRRSTIQLLIVSLHLQTDSITRESPSRTLAGMFKKDQPRQPQVKPRDPLRDELLAAVSRGDKAEVEALLPTAGVKTFKFSLDGETFEVSPLHLAAEGGWLSILKKILRYDADVNALNSDGKTALMCAIEMKRSPAATKLVNCHDTNVGLTDKLGRTALQMAAGKNLPTVVAALLQKQSDPNARDSLGQTPLLEVLWREDPNEDAREVIRLLLQASADPSLGRHISLSTPLHVAASKNLVDDLDVLAAAAAERFAYGVDLRMAVDEGEGYFGETPLWVAAREGNSAAVQILLNHGADANSFCDHLIYPTPLWAAVAAGSMETANLLLAKGARPNALNTEGKGILHESWPQLGESITGLMLEYNADVQLRDALGNEPLHSAVVNRRQDIVERLLDAGADINAQNRAGETALMLAASRNNPILTMQLLLRGANPNILDEDGTDAFYWACMVVGNVLSAGYILAAGSRGQDTSRAGSDNEHRMIDRPSRKGLRPIHVAARAGALETVRWLLYNGADASLRSWQPFEGMRVVGTAADVARESGHAVIEEEIANFLNGRRAEEPPRWSVEMRL